MLSQKGKKTVERNWTIFRLKGMIAALDSIEIRCTNIHTSDLIEAAIKSVAKVLAAIKKGSTL